MQTRLAEVSTHVMNIALEMHSFVFNAAMFMASKVEGGRVMEEHAIAEDSFRFYLSI